jgi:hypothetical protein
MASPGSRSRQRPAITSVDEVQESAGASAVDTINTARALTRYRVRTDEMAETTPPPSGPLAGASGRELRELQQFLLYLGSALTAAGEAVNHVELHLRRVAAAYGAPTHGSASCRPIWWWRWSLGARRRWSRLASSAVCSGSTRRRRCSSC